jgi:hypothetical protein
LDRLGGWELSKVLSDRKLSNWLADRELVSRINELNRGSANRNRWSYKVSLRITCDAGQNDRIALLELTGINNEWLLSSHSITNDAASLGRYVGGSDVVFLDQGLGNYVNSNFLNAFQVLGDYSAIELVCVLLYRCQSLVKCYLVLVSVNEVHYRWVLAWGGTVISHVLN